MKIDKYEDYIQKIIKEREMLDYFEFDDKVLFIKEEKNKKTFSIFFNYISRINADYTTVSKVFDLTFVSNKQESCQECKFFSVCNFCEIKSFVCVRDSVFDFKQKIIQKTIIRKILSNKKYGCIHSIEKYSDIIEEIKNNIILSEKKIKTMKELQHTLSAKMCEILID